ncbi:MAG: alanine--tRNA ligase [Myxococcota bacterium]
MTGDEIRSAFLRYFEERDHRVVPSSSLIPDRDPSLMFVNAGMVPFKRTFVGEETRDYSRAVSAQRCMRVSGKHNDLDDVGRSPSHQTLFEMLGNFSFGDYFKVEAIRYAWDLLTSGYGLEPDRLVVSVLEDDDDSWAIWRDEIGLEERRIFRLGEKENFWQMGDTGPCGPCSEIHLIHDRAAFEAGADPSQEGFTELWNLVFMQFAQAPDGSRSRLPKPSIDTGMGLERLAQVLQGVESNYDTDLFRPLLERAQELSGHRYGTDPDRDVSIRVVADHARACAFLIGDGVLPSNEGRGYVLRRVLRRAARHGVLLGLEGPFLYDVAGVVIDSMQGAHPELRERRAFIEETIRREEERFGRTLGRGLSLLDAEIARARSEKRRELSGEVVFKLYDTFGFPADLSEDILRGHGLGYEGEAFDRAMREQTERARAAWKGSGEGAPAELYSRVRSQGEVAFVGYERLEERASIRALIRDGECVDEAGEGDRIEVVVSTTPFYAESGGQVGDLGSIATSDGRVEIEDVQRPVDGLIVHQGRVVLGRVRVGDEAELRVDPDVRAATMRNHSATHLLHAALKSLVGPQCMQAGSRVDAEHTRFDFSHDAPLTPSQLVALEDQVNRQLLANRPRETRTMSYSEAIESGAVAIFEEKYGDVVRVVRFGEFSTELCGGTHVHATGEIGAFRIVSQSAVGSGVRRIEAVTGLGALAHARRQAELLQRAAAAARTSPAELEQRIQKLLERERSLERELRELLTRPAGAGGPDPLADAQIVSGVRVIASEVSGVGPRELRPMIDDLKARAGSAVILLASAHEGKAALALGVTDDLVERFKASELIGSIAQVIGGRGGGRAGFAQAGGSDVAAIGAAFERLREQIARDAKA